MSFNHKLDSKNNINIISLEGNLIDKEEAQQLASTVDKLIALQKNTFIINLQELAYMNSSGLNVLVNILTKARNSGGEAVISNVSEKVNKLLLITKLNSVFTITEDLDQAFDILNSN